MFKKFMIREKLLISYVFIIIFVILAVGLVNFEITSEGLEKDLLSYSDKYLIELSKNVESKIEDLNSDLFNVLKDSNLLYEKNFNDLMSFDTKKDDLKLLEINKLCAGILASNMYLESIMIMDFNDNMYYQSYSNYNGNKEKLNSILKEKLEKYTVLRRIDEHSFAIVKPMIDIDNSKFIGYVAFEINQNYFLNQFNIAASKGEWEIVLLDERNNLLSSTDESADIQLDFIKQNYNIKGVVQRSYQNKGKQYIFNTLASPKGYIRVMNIIPAKVISESSYKLLKTILWSSLIVLLAALIFALGFSRGITKNMGILIQKIKQLSKGDFTTKINIKTNDEVGMIADEFNHMTSEIQALINEVYLEQLSKEKAEKQAIEFEYSALRAKINPHFIYNVLEGINSMAKIQGSSSISEVTCLLAELLRDSLQDDRVYIFLEDELDYIDKYLGLKMLMRNNQFEVKKEIDEILLGAMVPRFILQPIVENAIKHGTDKITTKGIIIIKCFLKDNNLCLQVLDNGRGMKTHTSLIDNIEKSTWKNTKVGLKSIDKRLKFLYGNNYGARLTYDDDYTKVEIIMPYITNIEEGDENGVQISDS